MTHCMTRTALNIGDHHPRMGLKRITSRGTVSTMQQLLHRIMTRTTTPTTGTTVHHLHMAIHLLHTIHHQDLVILHHMGLLAMDIHLTTGLGILRLATGLHRGLGMDTDHVTMMTDHDRTETTRTGMTGTAKSGKMAKAERARKARALALLPSAKGIALQRTTMELRGLKSR